jgi:hypothetical protein
MVARMCRLGPSMGGWPRRVGVSSPLGEQTELTAVTVWAVANVHRPITVAYTTTPTAYRSAFTADSTVDGRPASEARTDR